jgi:hypothetical protein
VERRLGVVHPAAELGRKVISNPAA